MILVSVVLGLSGGKLVALDCGVDLAVRLLLEALTSLPLTSLRELAKLFLLPDLPPADRRSNTLLLGVVALLGLGDSRLGRDKRSMIELLLLSAFFSSFKDLPGRRLPCLSVCSSSILMMGTEVTYLPSTSVES